MRKAWGGAGGGGWSRCVAIVGGVTPGCTLWCRQHHRLSWSAIRSSSHGPIPGVSHHTPRHRPPPTPHFTPPPTPLTRMSSPSLVSSRDQPVRGPSPFSSRCSHTILFSLSHLAKLYRGERAALGGGWGGRGSSPQPHQPIPSITTKQMGPFVPTASSRRAHVSPGGRGRDRTVHWMCAHRCVNTC